jgi:hypothetical protein
LHQRFGDRVHFVDILVRQGHPGPGVPPYSTNEEKLRDGQRMKEDEALPWTVLVDDLYGAVHRDYGMLADPTYLIGTDGRVSFYNYWTHVPTLHRAIEALLASGGRGEVGSHRPFHPLAALTDGWRGLRRGLPQSFVDLETAMPGMASGPWLGYQLRNVLAPVALVAEPWPVRTRWMVTAVLAAAAAAVTAAVRGRPPGLERERRRARRALRASRSARHMQGPVPALRGDRM